MRSVAAAIVATTDTGILEVSWWGVIGVISVGVIQAEARSCVLVFADVGIVFVVGVVCIAFVIIIVVVAAVAVTSVAAVVLVIGAASCQDAG